MSALTSTRSRRKSSRGVTASAVLVLALSAATGAFAQTNVPPANTQVVAPKQVGFWTVIGWSQGYCAAERPLPGAAGGGATLQFVLARFQAGYRLALGAQEWELKPQTTFPIELIAHPILRSEASAVAVGPKLVVIELGADGQPHPVVLSAARAGRHPVPAVDRCPGERRRSVREQTGGGADD